MFLVDTNVLVFAANPDCQEHPKSLAFLERTRKARLPWYLTWGILYEFLRVCTHARVFRGPWTVEAGWEFVLGLLASPGVTVLTETRRHGEVAAQTFKEVPTIRGSLLHDAHTAILMREHGIRRIYTRDTDFHRFPFLEVVDPLAM